jgi:ATP-dependent Lon protease
MANTKFSCDKKSNATKKAAADKKYKKKRVVESSDDETDSFVDSDYETLEDEDDYYDEDEDDDFYDEEDDDGKMDESDDDENDNDEEDDDEEDDRRNTKKRKYETRSSTKSNKKNQKMTKKEEKAIKNEIENAFVSLIKNKLQGKIDEDEDSDSSEDDGNRKRRRCVNKKHKNKKVAKSSKKSSPKKNRRKNRRRSKSESEDDDDESSDEEYDEEEDDEDDEEYDEEEDIFVLGGGNENGPLIFLDGGMGMMQQSDEQDYKKMMQEDKDEKCNSDDEQTFMKETYKPATQNQEKQSSSTTSSPNVTEKARIKQKSSSKSSSTANKDKHSKNRRHDDRRNRNKKSSSSKKDKNDSDGKEDDIMDSSVQAKYEELVKVRDDLTQQLKKSPKSKILENAIQECRKSINELVKKERNRNTDKYFKLVHQDPKKSKNTNEMSYFKKKLSHQEQLKVMKDLKEINALTNTDKPYRLSLLESNIPPKFKAIALQKLNVLKSMEPSDSEYYKMKNWVDGFMRVPYGVYKSLTVRLTDGVDKCHEYMDQAKATLDSCTYGLDDAKMQILQMVGQWITNPDAMGTAIAIKGPPGTGKTTLVKEGISKILGREFAFIALGGTSDASFLEGHSYTYEGSTWGKIVSILMESKCMNPVIYFDELDKISDTPKGEEIASILTHLTDTSQNSQFHDKYFSEVDFDLSKCLFIFSYNDESKVNPILKDRMYRIQTKGYSPKEKIIIARKHLLPKIREQVSFKEDEVILSDDTLDHIINHPEFCKAEQGVRNLKRCLEIIHTKLNLFRLVKPEQNMFAKDIAIDVKFPFTVLKKHVDILIKSDDPMSQSLLAMYV